MINLFNITHNKRFPFIHINKSNLFAIFFISLFLGLAGFLLETIIEYASSTKIYDRGLLNGPFIPIYFVYGFICLLFVPIPTKSFANFIKYSFLFGIIVTLVEFVTGNVFELLTNAKLWSYSHIPLSGTYISFIISSIWGVLTSFFYMFIVIPLYKITLNINRTISLFILNAFIIVFSLDLTLTILDLINKGEYVEKYNIEGNDTLTSLFLLELVYYFLIIFLFYIFIKVKLIKKQKIGIILLYLLFVPIIINIYFLFTIK